MTNLQAAVGVAQLEQVDAFITARTQIATHYTQRLGDIPGLTFHCEPAWSKSVCWLFSFLVGPAFGMSRDALIDHLKRHEIESKPFFQPLPALPMYQENSVYSVAEHLSRCGISLPTSPHLQPEQIETIANTIREAYHTHGKSP